MPISIHGPYFERARRDEAARYTNVSFSQFGEDIIVDHILFSEMNMPDRGLYVDIGAFHPYYYNNTALLHMRGWEGINVDPSEEAIDLFKVARPHDISICAGVSDTEDELPFYSFENGAVNSFDPACRDAWVSAGWRLLETKIVKVSTFSAIIEPNLRGRKIDYLNIDAEGFDEKIISSIDFNLNKPKVITVEGNFDPAQFSSNSIFQKLTEHEYRLHSFAVMTAIFCSIVRE